MESVLKPFSMCSSCFISRVQLVYWYLIYFVALCVQVVSAVMFVAYTGIRTSPHACTADSTILAEGHISQALSGQAAGGA